jgi:ABC-type multidrug transport system permease subunit
VQATYGAVDHWSAILFYSMGFGAIAVGILLFAVLVVVWFYGQFIWSFTQWDLANVRLTPFKSLAQLIVVATFLGGTCVGLWCFSGAAWRNRKPGRASTSRRTAR